MVEIALTSKRVSFTIYLAKIAKYGGGLIGTATIFYPNLLQPKRRILNRPKLTVKKALG